MRCAIFLILSNIFILVLLTLVAKVIGMSTGIANADGSNDIGIGMIMVGICVMNVEICIVCAARWT